MKNRFIIIALLLLAILAACTEKVNLKLDSTYTRLVVDGYIRSDTQQYSISLTKTSDYFANAPAPRIVNAVVTLSDGTNFDTLTETDPGQSGIYVTGKNFTGKFDHTYKLGIHLSEAIAGNTGYSASCKLLKVTKLDSVKVIFRNDIGKAGFWIVKLYAQDPPGQKNYYLLNLYRNGKLWSDTISKVQVSDNSFFEGNYINGVETFYINNDHKYETLFPGDTVTLELSAITKEYYDFINEVKEAGFNIPFFSGPPANVVGNIDNGGIGFFAAYSSSFASTIVK